MLRVRHTFLHLTRLTTVLTSRAPWSERIALYNFQGRLQKRIRFPFEDRRLVLVVHAEASAVRTPPYIRPHILLLPFQGLNMKTLVDMNSQMNGKFPVRTIIQTGHVSVSMAIDNLALSSPPAPRSALLTCHNADSMNRSQKTDITWPKKIYV